ncbi:MAG: hypothetical protein MUF30_11965 [Burkholderiales bacterium]|nr:hypothetical protein [Burkholderiales bacterium]
MLVYVSLSERSAGRCRRARRGAGGVGNRRDEAKLIAFPAGSFYVVPAGVPYYSAVLEGETEFQEGGVGPSRNDMLAQ